MAQYAAEGVGHLEHLLRLSELELVERHQHMVQRWIRPHVHRSGGTGLRSFSKQGPAYVVAGLAALASPAGTEPAQHPTAEQPTQAIRAVPPVQ